MTDGTQRRNAWRRRLYLPAYATAEAARFAQTKPHTVAYWHYGKVRLFAKVYDKIVTVIQSQRPPFIYRVYKSGAFKRVL